MGYNNSCELSCDQCPAMYMGLSDEKRPAIGRVVEWLLEDEGGEMVSSMALRNSVSVAFQDMGIEEYTQRDISGVSLSARKIAARLDCVYMI